MASVRPNESMAVQVSVLVPVRNEERHIRETVTAMRAQQLDGTLELLFADGRSEDRTRDILMELARDDSRIRVLDNPQKHTASGLNVCLREARGEFVARMDAHTYYPDRYLQCGIERLRRGDAEWVSGPAVPRPSGLISRALALALASPLGRGGSAKWDEDPGGASERELDSGVFCGVWRRSTLLEMGGWDERWPVNQDSEMASRFLERGAKLVCLPAMAGYYVPRNSFSALARQYFRYGFYRARTFRRHPASMRASHLLAPSLLLTAVGAMCLPRRLRLPARVALIVYLLAIGGSGAAAAVRREARREAVLLPAVLLAMHLAWGFGTLLGMLRFGLPRAALMRLAGLPAESGAPHVHGEVFAPSLHGRAQ